MYIFVSGSGQLSLREEQDLKALKLITSLGEESLLEVFGEQPHIGSYGDPNHVWISVEWLRAQGPAGDAVWAREFQKMMQYASTKGWIHPTSGAVRVHVERIATA
jgi:hypothetical protein